MYTSFDPTVRGYRGRMTTTPFEPHEEPHDEVAAADPGRGAPEQAPGFGVAGEEPDETPEQAAKKGEAVEPPD